MNKSINMQHVNGVFSLTDLKKLPGFPSEERIKKGPVACVECGEKIPCDPCVSSCPFSAITMERNIIDLPVLNEDRCQGCGLCVAACPGQAIFLLDYTYSAYQAAVSFPYEYLPLPEKGNKVIAVNRKGEEVCEAEIVEVKVKEKFDKTAVITIAIPKKFINQVRFIKGVNHEK